MPAETRFEHYEVLRRDDGSLWELGRGAMGVTYKAVDTDLHCTVALKVINPAILDTEGTEQRFFREARAAAQLRHPNIATVLRLGKTEDATHFYAMEFCEGDTLDQFVAARGVLDVELALEFTLQVARALVLAEEHQVVHRDIKPANLIVVSQRGEGFVVKIIDFGLAKSVTGSANSWTSMSLATMGYIGTAHFSSPEQLEEGEVDVRSDIYSLGATLWFMLTGRPMFSGSVPRVMSAHLSSPLPWEQFDSIGLPESVRRLLSCMLAKSPKDRPQTALELKQLLQACLEDVRNPKLPESSPAADVLNNRWKLLEECQGPRGSVYRAVDLKQQGKIVSIRMLDSSLKPDTPEWQRLEQAITQFRSSVQGIVRPIQLDRDEKGEPFLVAEWVDGIPLVMLLRRRGYFSWKETLKVLNDLSPPFDFAVEHQLECGPFCKEEVVLSFPEGVSLESKLDEANKKQLTDWPEARAVIDLLPVNALVSSADENSVSMATILPGAASLNSASGQVPRLRDIAFLVYELLGGTAHSGGGRYVPIARVSAAGNDLLKSILVAPEEDQRLTASQFASELSATGGFDSTVKPAKTTPLPATDRARVKTALPIRRETTISTRIRTSVPAAVQQAPPSAQVEEPEVPRGKGKNWFILAAAALVLAIGLVWLFLSRKTERPPAKIVAENKSSPAASTSPASSPALPPLTGNLLSTQFSPKRDIRIEQRSGGMIYLISQSDETKRRSLQKSSEDLASVLFSPDENWLVLNERAHLNDSSGQLFWRTRPDDVQYSEIASLSSPNPSLTESAWRFYLKEVGLPEGTLRDQVRLSTVEWKPDSSAVNLRFDSFGAEGQKIVPRPYVCAYQVSDKRFTSETDVAGIRALVNNSVSSAAVKTAAASPPPQGQLTQQEAFAFAQANVSAMSAGDVNSLTSQYGTEVDYLDKGLVNNDIVRNELQQYFGRWPQTNWRVAGPVTVRPTESSKYQLSFPASFEVINPSANKRATGTARETMILAQDSTGAWKIVFQRETVTMSNRSSETERNRKNEKVYKAKPADDRRPNIPFQIPSNIPWPPKIPHP